MQAGCDVDRDRPAARVDTSVPLDGDGDGYFWHEDCDDDEPSVHPRAEERCNGVDDDCDGLVDLDDDDLVDGEWYYDGDGDGVGLQGLLAPTCAPPWGMVNAGGDCDDSDPEVHPGAKDPMDGVDRDCDGLDSMSLALTDWELVGDDERSWGSARVAGVGDVNGDGHGDLLVGAMGSERQGAAYLVLGPGGGRVSLPSADGVFVGLADGDQAGSSVAAAGDLNGDGLQDLLIGATGHEPAADGPLDVGSAFVVLGRAEGWSRTSLADADALLYGYEEGGCAGFSVAGVGDTDGDGHADLVLGGAASGSWSLSTAPLKMTGAAEGAQVGSSLTPVGDTDGDGFDDILVAAGCGVGDDRWPGVAWWVGGGG